MWIIRYYRLITYILRCVSYPSESPITLSLLTDSFIPLFSLIPNQIQEYSELRKINYSEAVCQLVTLGLNNMDLTKAIQKNNALMDKIYSKSVYSTDLLEQLYSDLEIDMISDPNKNQALNKFKNKYSRYKFDD